MRSDYMPPAQAEPSQIGPRGFGLVAMENIKAGDFVTDYRGEVGRPSEAFAALTNDEGHLA